MRKRMRFGVIAIVAILALTVGLTVTAFSQSSEDEADSDGGRREHQGADPHR